MERWTEKEIAKLHERKARGMKWEAIAKAHKRTVSACKQKWHKTQELCEPHNKQLELPFDDKPLAGQIVWHEIADQMEAESETDVDTGITRVGDMSIAFVAGVIAGLLGVLIINSF